MPVPPVEAGKKRASPPKGADVRTSDDGPTKGQANTTVGDTHANAGQSSACRKPTLEDQIASYRLMLRIRRFEEKAGQLYGLGVIAGFCHLYIGQEAVAAGLARAWRDGDKTITAYRNHGHALAAGADVTAMMSELCGRSSGLSAGKAGSVHLFWPDGNFFGGHGAIGTNAALGAGLAFSDQYKNTGAVTWCIVGDRAVDHGQVSEAMVLASEWSLPIVFVIENNSDLNADETTSVAGAKLFQRGQSIGIEGRAVDGMDVDAVAHAAYDAAEDVRKHARPLILECRTMQYRGHSMSDPGKYRNSSATSSASTLEDPIAKLGHQLLHDGFAEENLREIDQIVRDEINAATTFAKSDGEPSADNLVSDIRAKARAGQTPYRRIHGETSERAHTQTGDGPS
ncbi:MAG: thiamine pyrophosphate-dependent enzyme [Pseudomonadota bacterium]